MPKFRAKTRKGESEAPESVSRDPRTAAVEQADLADDGLEAAPGTTTEPGAREVGVEYSGAPGAEELSELIAQTGGDTAEEEARSEVDALTGKGEGTGDEDDDGVASFEDRLYQGRPDLEGASSGTFGDGDASDDSMGRDMSGSQDPIVNPITGEGATNPTGSFADYAASKGAREEGPSGDAGGGPAPGSGRSVADTFGGRVGWGNSDEPGQLGGKVQTRTVDGAKEYRETYSSIDKEGTTTTIVEHRGDAIPLTTQVTVVDANGNIVTTTTGVGTVEKEGTYPDGSPIEFKDASAAEKRRAEEARQKAEEARRQAEEAKRKAEEEAAKKKAEEEAAKKKAEDEAAKKKAEEDAKDQEQPGGRDGEEPVPLDEKLNDPLFQQYQQSKNAGGGGDGVTDPSETDDVTLKGKGSRTPQEAHDQAHDEAVGRFGQPAAGEDFRGAPRAGTPQNSLGELVRPGPDQDLVAGGGRTENPADAIPNTEPVVGMPAEDTTDDTEEASDDGGGSFLPPGDFTPVDAPPDLPDDVEIGGPTG